MTALTSARNPQYASRSRPASASSAARARNNSATVSRVVGVQSRTRCSNSRFRASLGALRGSMASALVIIGLLDAGRGERRAPPVPFEALGNGTLPLLIARAFVLGSDALRLGLDVR